MKIQIQWRDKNGGHCRIEEEPAAQKLLNRLAKRKNQFAVIHADGKKIGELASGNWGYAL